MNDERFDDGFAATEPLYAEPDERPGYRPVASAAEPGQSAPARGAGGRLLALAALLGVAALGWFAWQQQQRLQELSARFAELSAMLDSTGQTLNQSGASLAAQLQEQRGKLDANTAEIKKLWALTNERNRPAIEEQGKKLARLEAELQKLQQEMSRTSSSAREASAAAAAAKAQVAAMAAGVEAVKREGLADSAALDELKSQVAQARAGVGKLDEQLRGLRESVTRSSAENRKALASIDSFRRETNLQLQVIREQLATP
jgi:chromosome segregation ATPase